MTTSEQGSQPSGAILFRVDAAPHGRVASKKIGPSLSTSPTFGHKLAFCAARNSGDSRSPATPPRCVVRSAGLRCLPIPMLAVSLRNFSSAINDRASPPKPECHSEDLMQPSVDRPGLVWRVSTCPTTADVERIATVRRTGPNSSSAEVTPTGVVATARRNAAGSQDPPSP